jgi:hypothetical protein
MFRPLSALALLLGLALHAVAQDKKGKDYATFFPSIPGLYKSKVEKPEVGKGNPPEVYSQLCTYTCNEPNVTETLTVTIARDPAFKEKYSADALKKEKTPPKEVKVAKHQAYLWDLGNDKKRLVVVLADDKAVIAEQTGTNQDLVKWAGKWKVAVIEKALDTPPAVK